MHAHPLRRRAGWAAVLLVLWLPGVAWTQQTETPAEKTPPAVDAPRDLTPPAPTQPPPVGPSELIPQTPEAPPHPTIPAGPARVPTLPPPPPIGVPLFSLRPSLSLSGEYTDNFDQTRRGRDNLRTTVSPGLALLIEGRSIRGRVVGILTGAHDTIGDDDISLFYGVDAALAWDVTPRLKLRVADTLIRTDEPRQADRLELRRGRETYTQNIFTGEVLYRIVDVQTRAFYTNTVLLESSRDVDDVRTHVLGADVTVPILGDVVLTLGYEYVDSANDTDIRGHRGSGALQRRITPSVSVGIAGSYAERRVFEADPALPDDRFVLWTGSVFGSYVRVPRWTVTASVGVAHLQSDERGDQTAPAAAITISHAFVRGVGTLTAERGYSETYTSGEDFGVVETQGVILAFTYPLTPFITGTVNGFYRENDFTGVAGPAARGREETFGGGAQLTWRPRPWLSVGLDYSYRRVHADEDFQENRVRLTVGASF